MKTVRMTTAQAVVRFLSLQWSERDGLEQRLIPGIWGIFGHGNVAGLGQALEECGQSLPLYVPRNEQAAVHAAIGFAKMNDRLAAMAVTASVGPGSTNMLTGAATATVNRLPVLLLPSDTFASRRPDPVLQGLEHDNERDLSVNDAFRPLSRYFDRITRPEQLLASLPEAMRVLVSPAATGAVTLCLPEDVQTEACDFPVSLFEKRVWRVPRQPAERLMVEEAAGMLRRAERPLVVTGGGTIYSGATEALKRLVEATGLPVCETQAGKGALPWDHPQLVGPLGANGGTAANRLAREADLILAVGSRLGDFVTASRTAFQHPDVNIVGLNVASLDAHKLGALPLVADARAGLEALAGALQSWRVPEGYAAEAQRLKTEWDALVSETRKVDDPENLSQAAVIAVVNEFADKRDVVVCAAGSMPGDLLKLWRAEDPKSYHLEYGFSCMGYEIAGGLGAKLADPAREVYVFCGDGSYLMMNSEIVTAVQEGLKLTVLLIDNHGFQSIHGLQRSLGSPSFGNELRYRQGARLTGDYVAVDYTAHAASMGAHALFAATLAELEAALREAKARQETTVIVVPTDPEKRVPNFGGWWDVPVAEVSEQDSVRAARAAYEEARKGQRVLL
ncbi:MAG: 3D-(3,5/4)-trihydroxycyclohexane-1,2-dione acylhydrolase (decyclizing) [Deinococcota bacterium]|nr:3D-(3,5/4)-trihydroxycyclohexane-1,2-dione acylhydrolase (decyclizing) [Deinococcota bacterium]